MEASVRRTSARELGDFRSTNVRVPRVVEIELNIIKSNIFFLAVHCGMILANVLEICEAVELLIEYVRFFSLIGFSDFFYARICSNGKSLLR